MRIRVPLIIEESLMKEIDAIAGEKHRRAATIEAALSEYVSRHNRKAKKAAATPVKARAAATAKR